LRKSNGLGLDYRGTRPKLTHLNSLRITFSKKGELQKKHLWKFLRGPIRSQRCCQNIDGLDMKSSLNIEHFPKKTIGKTTRGTFNSSFVNNDEAILILRAKSQSRLSVALFESGAPANMERA